MLTIGLALGAVMLAPVASRAGELRVTVTNVRSDTGELLIGLYESEAGFDAAIANATKTGLMADRNRLIGVAMRARAGAQQAVFTQLPPGRYAVIVIHDENDNGRLDTNALGAPAEGYGFSNDAHGFMSAPAFDAAALTIADSDRSVAIALTYPLRIPPADQSDYDRLIGAQSAK
jgi:uncharacterized protein (DUF2141 family)